ncbi:hypothetical protein Sjap_018308 [Stephania japonica]|uniref:Uncharacterized protein n=1 Tax=Stephania japonica TaxID=461633 RepID=A0AAP0I7R8_9MAGN
MIYVLVSAIHLSRPLIPLPNVSLTSPEVVVAGATRRRQNQAIRANPISFFSQIPNVLPKETPPPPHLPLPLPLPPSHPLLLPLTNQPPLLLTPHQNPNPNPNPNPPPQPQPQPFTFTIKLLAFDRFSALSRCLRSLSAAHYDADRVNLHIFIDHFAPIDMKKVEFLDDRLNVSHRILDFVDGFSWGYGEKLVHYRTANAGLQAQWLEAWWPTSDDDFVFVVEDDLEVSPLYYRFLKGLILNYYYNSSNFSPFVYGASLQRPRFVPVSNLAVEVVNVDTSFITGKHGNKLHVSSDSRIFLYQLVGTWGQLLFPKPWKEFRLWYDTHKAKDIKPILEGMVTTGWYKRMGERIWTPWFIKFIHSRGYFNLYTNFLHERALSVSHRDAGVNYGKTAGPDSYLLDESSLDFNFLEMQPLKNLKWYDFCFRELLPGRILRSYDELSHFFSSVQRKKTVVFVSLYRISHAVAKNMLCHFERLDIKNYILMGPSSSNSLLELARRGHPVIDSVQLLNSNNDHKLKSIKRSEPESIEEILVKAHVMEACISSGYNCWLTNGNVLPINTDSFYNADDVSSDISIAKDVELLFVRSSSMTMKLWTEEFSRRIAAMANTMVSKYSLSRDRMRLSYFMMKSLTEKGMSVARVNELSFCVKIDTDVGNKTSIELGKKMVSWSSETDTVFTRKRLEDLGLWVVDGDFTCIAVVCHQS